MSKDTSNKASKPAKMRPTAEEGAQPYDPETLVGQTLAERYEVERCIGKGGMGVVYLASQSALDRKVVIKVLPSSFIDDEEAIARFEREARGMSRLQHPNIVAIYDFGHEDERTYICMEYVAGETLSRRLKRDGALSIEAFSHVASQILQGINEAHERGMIHRDIKPSNIMLTERHGQQDYVKILDFGLAKLVKGARDVTSEQSLVGSTSFLSPEQIMGNDIDQRIDVYALGVLFFYMLSGEKPFQADEDITVLYQHVHKDPPPLVEHLPEGSRVPPALTDLIERMLAKDPDDRPGSAASVLEELQQIMTRTSLEIAWDPSDDMAGDDPSARLERGRFRTPMHQGHVAASGPQPAPQLGEAGSGSQQTFVTGEQMLQLQRENNRRTVFVAIVAALVAGAAFFAFFALRDDHASSAEVTSEIARAERLIEQQKLGQAENTLELIESDVKHHAELKSPYAATRDRLETARLLSDAKIYADQGRLDEAIEAYKRALSRNGSLEQAKNALDVLRKKRRAKAEEAKMRAERPPDEPFEDTTDDDTSKADEAAPDDSEKADEPPPKRAKKERETRSKEKAQPDRPRAKKSKAPAEEENAALLPVENQPADKPEDEADSDGDDEVQLLPMD